MSHFYAYLSRLKNIHRWGLMHNTQQENVQEHSWQVAMVAHALGVLRNARFGGGADPERAAVLAVFHEAAEVLTGDIATPVKYHNPEIRQSFRQIEDLASQRLLNMMPQDMQEEYDSLILHMEEESEWPRVKAADRICAYLKCEEELKAGNGEFAKAREAVLRSIRESELPEVHAFMEEFAPSFALTLDELND